MVTTITTANRDLKNTGLINTEAQHPATEYHQKLFTDGLVLKKGVNRHKKVFIISGPFKK